MHRSTIRLKANNGQYLCAEGGGGRELVANRTLPREWETFVLLDLDGSPLKSGDQVALQAYNGMYVCAEGGGGREMNATRSVASIWETFRILHADGSDGEIRHGQGIAFQAYNSQYVCAEGGGGREVLANRNAIGPWETFSIEILEAGQVSIDLDSDLGNGHFMMTRGVMRGNGHIDAQTRTYTVTSLGGFTGGVQFLLADTNGRAIGQSELHTFGVDGRWIGRSDRTDYWSEDIDLDIASRTEEIHVHQFWAPRWSALKTIVDNAVAVGGPIIDLIRDIKAAGGDAK